MRLSLRIGAAGRRLLRNVGAGTAAQVLTAVAAIWAIPQLLARLGPEGYGVLSLAGAVVGYFSVVDLGLGNAVLQRLAQARHERPEALGEVVGTSGAALATIGLVLSLVILATAEPLSTVLVRDDSGARPVVATAVRLCAFGAVPALLRPLFEAILASAECLVPCYVATVVANLLRTVGVVVALAWWPSVTVAVGVLVCATATQTVLLLAPAWRTLAGMRVAQLRCTRRELGEAVRLGSVCWLGNATALVGNQIDRFVVGAIAGLGVLGYYAAALEIAQRLFVLPNVLGRAGFARLAATFGRGESAEGQREVRRFFVATTLAAAVPAISIAFHATPLLVALTGQAQTAIAGPALAALVCGVALNVSAHAPIVALQLRVDLARLAAVNVVTLLVQVPVSLAATAALGPTGTALGWMGTQAVGAGALHALAAVRHGVRLSGEAFRILCGVGSAAAAVGALLAVWSAEPRLDLGTLGRLADVLPALAVAAAATGVACAIAVGAGRWRSVPLTWAVK